MFCPEFARFPEFLQNLSERRILWSLCLVDFHTLTLQLPIQTLYSVTPEVFVSSLENCPNFRKTSTPSGKLKYHLGKFIWSSHLTSGLRFLLGTLFESQVFRV